MFGSLWKYYDRYLDNYSYICYFIFIDFIFQTRTENIIEKMVAFLHYQENKCSISPNFLFFIFFILKTVYLLFHV